MDAPDPNLVTSGKGAAFHKAHPRYGGRAKGTPNKTTRNIRDAMTESAVKHGMGPHIRFRRVLTLVREGSP